MQKASAEKDHEETYPGSTFQSHILGISAPSSESAVSDVLQAKRSDPQEQFQYLHVPTPPQSFPEADGAKHCLQYRQAQQFSTSLFPKAKEVKVGGQLPLK